MNEPLGLVSAFVAGVLLGTFFFGGLWWTVRRGVSSERPTLWFLGSMLLRTGIVLAGFYFVLGSDWKRVLAGLTGFIVARVVVTRLVRAAKQPGPPARKAGHAP
ncbi:MAG TPA: ATP synthase subunit I [Casimicrobiaceae bacterium]|nr:ATP synthase subunit I [Casimicrobiaceae bacterium]